MNFVDNLARIFIAVVLIGFGEVQIIGGIVPNLISFSLFVGAIVYLVLTGKMAVMLGIKKS